MTKIIKPLHQNQEPPAHNPPLENRKQWEAKVFSGASYFTVSRRIGPGKFNTQEFRQLPDAMRAAVVAEKIDGKWRFFHDPKAMLYAVTAEGRSFCIPPKEWLSYLTKWEKGHGHVMGQTTAQPR